MNRRDALRTTAATIGSLIGGRRLAAQDPSSTRSASGENLFVNPASGHDSNGGTRDLPLRTLAEAGGGSVSARGVAPSRSSWPKVSMRWAKPPC